MDEEEHLWATVSGIDSDGLEILADLKRLQAGELILTRRPSFCVI